MAATTVERKLTAILSADVKGYSRLMGEDEVGTLRTLTAYREVTDSLIHQHRGRIVGAAGESVLAEFASAVDAVQCAVEIQQALKAKNAELSPDRRMEFRIGINVGDVTVEGPQIYGDGVNIAARLEALADAGGICISGTVYDQVENKLSLGYEDLGEQTVKNIAKPVRVYRVVEPEAIANVQASRDETALLLPLPDKPSIIVLPFVNMSGDPEQEYFSDGMTEDLITDLSKLSGLFVIARNSSFYYKGKAVKMEEVSKELGVQYVLKGSVRKADNLVRITAQLADAATSYHLWAEHYDRELQGIFALQDDIRQKIVTALRVKLLPEEQELLKHFPTNNLEAYDYVLRGSEYYLRFTKAANAQARQMFEKAIELDPQYAAAYAALGTAYYLDWAFFWSDSPQALDQAFELARRAVALNNSLPMAHWLLGLAYLYRKQYEQAIAEEERALALGPNAIFNYTGLAFVLTCIGRLKEAIELAERAIRLDPHYAGGYALDLGRAYYLLGRHEEAIAALQKTLTWNPNFLATHVLLAATYNELGQEEEARAEVAEVLRMAPNASLEGLRQRLPFKDPAVSERWLAALRKAGLQ